MAAYVHSALRACESNTISIGVRSKRMQLGRAGPSLIEGTKEEWVQDVRTAGAGPGCAVARRCLIMIEA
jgi:hypothetical protein